MNETKTEWRDCADPDELAAAVAAGVEVQVDRGSHTRQTVCVTVDEFRANLSVGSRYRLPADWSPEPPADDEPCATNPCEACRGRAVRATDECTLSPDRVGSPAGNDHPVTIPPADDLRERRVWNCKIGGRVGVLPGGADAPMRRAVADAFTAETGYPVEFCFSGWGDDLDESELAVVENREPDPEVIRAALVKRLTALPGGSTVDTAPPVPPWPGAVLSGLTDEDGVPTWLAQAGQVRGEQVRCRSDLGWDDNDEPGGHIADVWVEVRAPRAVPEPETERVAEALATEWRKRADRLARWAGDPAPQDADRVQFWLGAAEAFREAAIEVLKDGDR